MHWKRLAALTEDALKYSEYLTHLQTLLNENDILFDNLKFARTHVNVSMKTAMKNLQGKHTR